MFDTRGRQTPPRTRRATARGHVPSHTPAVPQRNSWRVGTRRGPLRMVLLIAPATGARTTVEACSGIAKASKYFL
jgi:hypothetical protein